MADGILAAVNENGNVDRFVDTNGGVHYIEPKRFEQAVNQINESATKVKEAETAATDAVSKCQAQTTACTDATTNCINETNRAKTQTDGMETRISGIESSVANIRDYACASMLSHETMTSGSSIDIPTLNQWIVIGAIVPVTVADNEKSIVVPCSVVNDFVSGSLCYLNGPDSNLVTVTMSISSTGLTYGNCTVQQVGIYDNVVSRNQQITGIIGLIRTYQTL